MVLQWHEKTLQDIVSQFKADLVLGLTEAEAVRRLKEV